MITAKKSNVNIRELNVWLTSDYDYLAITHAIWGHSRHELLYLLDTKEGCNRGRGLSAAI